MKRIMSIVFIIGVILSFFMYKYLYLNKYPTLGKIALVSILLSSFIAALASYFLRVLSLPQGIRV